MRITWTGAAGFCIETGGQAWLIDPFLRRGLDALPGLPDGVSAIFLSHAHFDHAADVPHIARETDAGIFCSSGAARTLQRRGVSPSQITAVGEGDRLCWDAYEATCSPSSHVRFDVPLVLATLRRALPRLPALAPLLLRWPPGRVLGWRFTLKQENDRAVLHLGSAGSTEEELARLAALGPVDVLLAPLQGHSHICQIAAHLVARLRPRLAIPHHHDDFFPPISQDVDIAPFAEAVGAMPESCEVIQLTIGQTVTV